MNKDELEKTFRMEFYKHWVAISENIIIRDLAASCAKIAEQYNNSNLEELEKWIDEVIEEQHYEIAKAAFNEVKDKLQSLKQES
jgi:hypothetical protein